VSGSVASILFQTWNLLKGSLSEKIDGTHSTLLILDDLMNETNQNVTDLFTKGSHHRNLSVAYIVQNLFNNGKHRTISLNSHYIVVFKNPRHASQIVHLAKQAYPPKLFKKHLKTQHLLLSVICCWTSSSAHPTNSVFVQKFFQTRRQWFTYLVENNDVTVGPPRIDAQTSFPLESKDGSKYP